MKQLGKLIGYCGLALLSACRECPEDEIIGDAYLTTATKQIVAFTDGTATYRNAADNQMRLTSSGRNPNGDTLRFVSIVQTCESGWFDHSSIGFYAPSTQTTYENNSIGITLEADIRAVVQPNPYDTVLVDLLSVGIINKNTDRVENYFSVPVSLRGNIIEPSALDTLYWVTPYRLMPDTTLLGVPLTNAFYAKDKFNGGEVFITAEQGLAAFQIDSVLWVRD